MQRPKLNFSFKTYLQYKKIRLQVSHPENTVTSIVASAILHAAFGAVTDIRPRPMPNVAMLGVSLRVELQLEFFRGRFCTLTY